MREEARASLSALLKTPTCNLEGDGEERRDTRLLLSLGLTRCNYKGVRGEEIPLLATHIHTHTQGGAGVANGKIQETGSSSSSRGYTERRQDFQIIFKNIFTGVDRFQRLESKVTFVNSK